MASNSSLRMALLVAAGVASIAGQGSAATLGRAQVVVNRIGGGQPSFKEIFIPISETEYQTPPASLAASLGFPGKEPFLRSLARATAGIDVPDGSLSGTISTFARQEAPGNNSQATANSKVSYAETFNVLSDILPDGTPVDVEFELKLSYLASAGVTGVGTCCGISNQYDIALKVSRPFQNPVFFSRGGAFGGGGIEDVLTLDFGGFVTQFAVGEELDFELSFEMDSLAFAAAVYQTDRDGQNGRYFPGQAEAAASASLFFASEVTQSSGAAAAAARAAGPIAYLFSPTAGFALPGREVFDLANVAAHLPPLVFVPEPGTHAIFGAGLAAMAWRARKRLRGANG